MSVIGIEIEVGQTWRTQGGARVLVVQDDGSDTPFKGDDGVWRTARGTHPETGGASESQYAFVELLEDPSEQPAGLKPSEGNIAKMAAEARAHAEQLPRVWVVGDTWLVRSGAHVHITEVLESGGVICDDGVRRLSDGFFYADRTISAKDLVKWLSPAVEPAPTATAPTVSAPDILHAAAKHMRDRAATYDKPEGERSMAQTVEIFNLYHGTQLTEAQGWHFMQVLKDVRLFTRDGYHADSGEDGVAYGALKCEAKAKEVNQ